MNIAQRDLVSSMVLGFCLYGITTAYAAQKEVLWGNLYKAPLLKSFTLVEKKVKPAGFHFPPNLAIDKNSPNTLHFVKAERDDQQISHLRYNQYYRGIPVWGTQLIYHLAPKATTLTGMLATELEKDITTVDGKLSLQQAKDIATAQANPNDKIRAKKIIYFDEQVSKKAKLAYLVSYLSRNAQGPIFPHFIIDANSGKILLNWDGLPHQQIGQGLGGVTFNNLSYRPGKYQFGPVNAGLNTFGKFDVLRQNNRCHFKSNRLQILNLENQTEAQLPFPLPVPAADAKRYNLTPFSYACSAPSFLNSNDNGFAPVNQGLSPINDVAYFIQQAYEMYTNQYVLSYPIGHALPLLIYTHIDNYNNAFACSPSCMDGIGPQQLVFGNGNADNAPYTDVGTSGHEFAHLVTDNFSTLIYEGQSGGINEAFSDMGEFALKSYLKKTYRWIWNGRDWTIGLDISKIKKPERYMNNPPLDGHSIANAAYFVPKMDVHYSSGVFNKAFYLLAMTPGWSVEQAFRVMLDANMNYWIPNTNFYYGACGVIQAAYNRGYNYSDVINAFALVGVTCLVGEELIAQITEEG